MSAALAVALKCGCDVMRITMVGEQVLPEVADHRRRVDAVADRPGDQVTDSIRFAGLHSSFGVTGIEQVKPL